MTDSPSDRDDSTHFGYSDVPLSEKHEKTAVRQSFQPEWIATTPPVRRS
jgi:hypothetical protein